MFYVDDTNIKNVDVLLFNLSLSYNHIYFMFLSEFKTIML